MKARAWRGVILALHGFTDSRDGWELPAPGFRAGGLRGVRAGPARLRRHGRARPGLGRAPQRMVDDVRPNCWPSCARVIPGRPVVLMGESMGGAVAALLAARPGRTGPDATVLLAPAVWGRGQMDVRLYSPRWCWPTRWRRDWVPNPAAWRSTSGPATTFPR